MPSPLHPVGRFGRTLLQVLLLILIWLAAVQLSSRWLHGLPPTVIGIALALVLLGLGLVRREWLADGAGWLLREMLLFFIPVVIAVLQYQHVLEGKLLTILLVITASTACVMLATALAVDLAWRLEARWRSVESSSSPEDQP